MTTRTDVDVRPLSGALGAEVNGIDLTNLDAETWQQLHELWLQHLVLFFPGQALSPDAHRALAARLGDAEIHPFIPKLDDAHPEIVVLDSEGGAKADVWHTDVTFTPKPPMASILRMDTCPPVGGDTIWTNQYLAYELLSPPIRDLVDGLSAVHTAASYGQPEIATTHPAVRVHPETGRRSLFVNRTFTSHFVELGRAESDSVLEMLCRWSEQPQFQCRYQWTPGAVGLWDNRCTQHYAINDYRERRVIHRVTVLGDVPQGPPSRYEPYANPTGSVYESLRTVTDRHQADDRTNSFD